MRNSSKILLGAATVIAGGGAVLYMLNSRAKISNALGPSITLSSRSIPAGGQVSVTGSGFTPKGIVNISSLGGITPVQASGSGMFSAGIVFGPSTVAGTYTITATDVYTGVRAAAQISITAASNILLLFAQFLTKVQQQIPSSLWQSQGLQNFLMQEQNVLSSNPTQQYLAIVENNIAGLLSMSGYNITT